VWYDFIAADIYTCDHICEKVPFAHILYASKAKCYRTVLILLAKFLEKYDGETKEQNAEKMNEILEKWMLKDWN